MADFYAESAYFLPVTSLSFSVKPKMSGISKKKRN